MLNIHRDLVPKIIIDVVMNEFISRIQERMNTFPQSFCFLYFITFSFYITFIYVIFHVDNFFFLQIYVLYLHVRNFLTIWRNNFYSPLHSTDSIIILMKFFVCTQWENKKTKKCRPLIINVFHTEHYRNEKKDQRKKYHSDKT